MSNSTEANLEEFYKLLCKNTKGLSINPNEVIYEHITIIEDTPYILEQISETYKFQLSELEKLATSALASGTTQVLKIRCSQHYLHDWSNDYVGDYKVISEKSLEGEFSFKLEIGNNPNLSLSNTF